MYPRNNASPERIAVGQVVLIADGTIQTSAVLITVRGQGGAEASGGGTTAYGADGTVYYTPIQAETNYTSFVVIAKKAACFSVSQTIITSASSTAGLVLMPGTIQDLDELNTAQDAQHAITHSQLETLSASPGVGARPYVPSTITVVAGSGASGSASDLANDDANVYTVNDSAGTLTLDLDYEVGAGATAIQLLLVAAAQGNGDDLTLQFYDQVGLAWDTIDTLTGANALTYSSFDKTVVGQYTTNTGLFQARITGTGLSSATLTINKAVGYGLAIGSGIENGSTITLDAATTNSNLIGYNWTLVLANQDISGSYISGAKSVTGLSQTANGSPFMIENCTKLDSPTLQAECSIENCGIAGLIFNSTAGGAADEIILRNDYSVVAGAGSPTVDADTNITKTTSLNARGYHGGAVWQLNAFVTASIEVYGGGGHTIDAGGADVEFRGVSTRSISVINATADSTIRIISTSGPISVNGSGGTVEVYGFHSGVTDLSSAAVTILDFGFDTSDAASDLKQDIHSGAFAGLQGAGFNTATDSLAALQELIAGIPDVAATTAAIRAMVVETEGSITLQEVLSVGLAVLAGESTNGGKTFLSPNGNATRAAATTNASNERTAMTLTPSA